MPAAVPAGRTEARLIAIDVPYLRPSTHDTGSEAGSGGSLILAGGRCDDPA